MSSDLVVASPRMRAPSPCQAITPFARSAGFDLVDSFYDEAVSGADHVAARPGFAAMLERNGLNLMSRDTSVKSLEYPFPAFQAEALELKSQSHGTLSSSIRHHGE